jgi:hypothetical protein
VTHARDGATMLDLHRVSSKIVAASDHALKENANVGNIAPGTIDHRPAPGP